MEQSHGLQASTTKSIMMGQDVIVLIRIMPNSILILLAHPARHQSRVHQAMVDAISGMAGIHVHDLYQSYPDYFIDVAREKALLHGIKLLIFQCPMYWYSTPPLLKLWQDVVLERGYAYGTGGDVLRGIDFLVAMSTGGNAEAYRAGGYNRFSVPELLRPLEATANLCGMRYYQPFLFQGSYTVTQDQLRAHGARYRQLLQEYLHQGPGQWQRLNAYADEVCQ